MAGYNPLSYFSFGKKKDSSESAEGSEQLERGSARSSARSATASSATKEPVQSSVDTDAEQEPLAEGGPRAPPPRRRLPQLTAVVAMMQASSAKQEPKSLVGAASRLLNRRQRLGASLRPGPGSWRRARPM